MLTHARLLLILLPAIALSACSGGSGGGGSYANSNPSSNSATNNPTPPLGSTSNSQVTLTISWTAPTHRVNGTPLSGAEISGYEIYYFRDNSPEKEDEIIAINDGNALQTQTPPLGAGTYHFAIATIDTQGLYSDTSDYVTISIH